ncbi:Uncharacterized protein HZ326_0115 [Fusarium oxysporum f. sp. albedinis]|nr:Uncharacterized protein HZ326_0115 [Fusarium oxysporum f. sp. albedinis]
MVDQQNMPQNLCTAPMTARNYLSCRRIDAEMNGNTVDQIPSEPNFGNKEPNLTQVIDMIGLRSKDGKLSTQSVQPRSRSLPYCRLCWQLRQLHDVNSLLSLASMGTELKERFARGHILVDGEEDSGCIPLSRPGAHLGRVNVLAGTTDCYRVQLKGTVTQYTGVSVASTDVHITGRSSNDERVMAGSLVFIILIGIKATE